MALVSLTDLDGQTVTVETEKVYRLTAVPAQLLPAGIVAGTYVDYFDKGTRVAIDGAPGAVRLLLAAGGWPNVELTQLNGDYVCFGTESLFSLEPVPPTLLPVLVADGTYVVQSEEGERLAVQGTVAATAAAWGAAPPPPAGPGLVQYYGRFDAAGTELAPSGGSTMGGLPIAGIAVGLGAVQITLSAAFTSAMALESSVLVSAETDGIVGAPIANAAIVDTAGVISIDVALYDAFGPAPANVPFNVLLTRWSA